MDIGASFYLFFATSSTTSTTTSAISMMILAMFFLLPFVYPYFKIPSDHFNGDIDDHPARVPEYDDDPVLQTTG